MIVYLIFNYLCPAAEEKGAGQEAGKTKADGSKPPGDIVGMHLIHEVPLKNDKHNFDDIKLDQKILVDEKCVTIRCFACKKAEEKITSVEMQTIMKSNHTFSK